MVDSYIHGKKFRNEISNHMDTWKTRGGKSQRKEELKREDQRKSQMKEGAGAPKGRKAAIHYLFPTVCGSGGSKSRLAKAADAEASDQMRDEPLHAVEHV